MTNCSTTPPDQPFALSEICRDCRLRRLLSVAPAIVFSSRLSDWETEYISENTLEILGYPPEDFLATQQFWLERVHPDDLPSTMAAGSALEPGHPVVREYRFLHADGGWRWMRDELRLLLDAEGRPDSIAGSWIDVTARRAAEAELRAREEIFSAIAASATEAITLYDLESGRFVEFNETAHRELGYTREEFSQLGPRDIQAEHSPEQIARNIAEVAATGHSAFETRHRHRDGSVRDALVSLSALRLRGAGYMAAIWTDITARKRFEQELVAERASLARRVEERTCELSQLNAELARAVRAKDEFLATMSHELRTPLHAILALGEGLLEGVRGTLNERQTAALRSIEASGQHLLGLIGDILDLSKIEAGRLELEPAEVAVGELCHSSLRLVREAAEKKHLQLGFELDDQLAQITVDPRRMKQCLVNLLTNAVKFTEAGGRVSLRVSRDPAGDAMRFTVADTGIGIAPESISLLFKPFTQLDSRLNRQHEGTGLGLSLAHRIAELHGGSLTVESKLGEGSRFTVSIPHRPARWEPVVAGSETAAPAGLLAGKSALIVEDNAAHSELLRAQLASLGLSSSSLLTGERAVEIAAENRPDVVLLDLLLPGTPGWEVLSALKTDPRTSAVPVVVVSVIGERAGLIAAGADESILKPFSRQTLQRALTAALDRRLGAPPEPAKAAPPTEVLPRILLAEDNEVNVLAIGDYLVDKGYQVIVARNGREAVARAAESRPDLILMDIQMPEMDGLEATRCLREQPELAAIPIVALTALAMPGDRERCLAAGIDEYLTKPVSLRGLIDTIERELAKAARQKTAALATAPGGSA